MGISFSLTAKKHGNNSRVFCKSLPPPSLPRGVILPSLTSWYRHGESNPDYQDENLAS